MSFYQSCIFRDRPLAREREERKRKRDSEASVFQNQSSRPRVTKCIVDLVDLRWFTARSWALSMARPAFWPELRIDTQVASGAPRARAAKSRVPDAQFSLVAPDRPPPSPSAASSPPSSHSSSRARMASRSRSSPLLGGGVVAQVLAEVAVEGAVADRLARGQVQLVLVVEDGVVVLVGVRVPAVLLMVGARVRQRVVGMLVQALELDVVVVGRHGVEVGRVQRRGRAIRLPVLVRIAAFGARHHRRPLRAELGTAAAAAAADGLPLLWRLVVVVVVRVR